MDKPVFRNHTKPIAVLLIIFIVDQWSKWHIFENVLRQSGDRIPLLDWLMVNRSMADTISSYSDFAAVKITGFFNFVAVWNTGVSFGMFQNMGDLGPYILTTFAALVGLAVFIWGLKSEQALEKWACILIAAGAFGNAYDRIRFKAVADFLDLHVSGYHWPAFNIADASITLGAGLLIVYIMFFDSKVRDNKE